MNSFAAALASTSSIQPGVTANGGAALASSGNELVDLFFVIGSARNQDISAKFLKALDTDLVRALQILFWARDIRGGAGERDTFRKLLAVLESKRADLAVQLVPLIPKYGRWDDLASFVVPHVRQSALAYWAEAITQGHGLAAKWAHRQGPLANELRKIMGMDPKTFRKTVVSATKVVESHMCAKQWAEINYSHVPSVAGARYQKAFGRRDPVRYTEFKAAALAGKAKINASALFPYDVLRSVDYGDPAAALAQWENLPNYIGDSGFILPLIDTSGSMGAIVGGNSRLTCMDVAVSLGLYLADKQKGPFANMFLNFDSKSKIHQLKGNLLEKLHQIKTCNWGGSTNIESAFKEILRVAVLGNVAPDQMPRYLLVLSDIGFDPSSHNAGQSAFDLAKEMFGRHGYTLPTIVWWNLAHRPGGYGGDSNTPVSANTANTAMVSGFSPSIVKSILKSGAVTPEGIMMETLDSPRYAPVAQAVLSV
jgi:hypothetical protein